MTALAQMTPSATLSDLRSSAFDHEVKLLRQQYSVFGTLDCTQIKDVDWSGLYKSLKKFHTSEFLPDQRLLILMDHDHYREDLPYGLIMEGLQRMINAVDISNYFVHVITTNKNFGTESRLLHQNVSTDPVNINFSVIEGEFVRHSNDTDLARFDPCSIVHEMDDRDCWQQSDLSKSKTFCMAPWTHLFVAPDQKVYPCCVSTHEIGDLRSSSLDQIWNSAGMRDLRIHMLREQSHPACTKCYINEKSGKDSYRAYINRKLQKRFGKVSENIDHEPYPDFELNYLHFKFSNLCNLACRMCSHNNSSSWHAVSTSMGQIPIDSPALITANSDGALLAQFVKHINTVDLIKFTGGEPLMMQEFYDILDILRSKQKTNVELFYNTNLTRLVYRDRNILDIWQDFSNVVVAASLDAEGSRAEYLRSFCHWDTIVENRKHIQQQCPHVYFFVSATVSILNVLHLPDFHRSWVEKGLINIQDFSLELLLDPQVLSIRNAPLSLKALIKEKYCQHLEWLYTNDKNGRSIASFEAVLKWIDYQQDFDKQGFWHFIDSLDRYHGTKLLDTFPELHILTE